MHLLVKRGVLPLIFWSLRILGLILLLAFRCGVAISLRFFAFRFLVLASAIAILGLEIASFVFAYHSPELHDARGLTISESSSFDCLVEVLSFPYSGIDEDFGVSCFRTILCIGRIVVNNFLIPGYLAFAWVLRVVGFSVLESVPYVPMFKAIFDKVIPEVNSTEVVIIFIFNFIV